MSVPHFKTPYHFRGNREGAVYFALAPRLGLVKIGFSTKWRLRMYDLQQASPEKLRLIALLPGVNGELEEALHNAFRDSHSHHEWFEYKLEVKSFVRWMQENATIEGDDLVDALREARWI